MVFIELLYNLGVLVSLCVFAGMFTGWREGKWQARTIQGLIFGLTAIIGMLKPFELTPGLFFDGRSIVLSIAAFFYGPITAIVAGSMAIVCRILQGGIGTVMGVSVIVASCLIGIGFFYNTKQDKDISVLRLYILGILVHIAMLLLTFTLPEGRSITTLQNIGLPVIIAYPLMTALIGKALSDQKARQRYLKELNENREALNTSNKEYEELVRTIPIGIYKIKREPESKLVFTYVSPKWCELMKLEGETVKNDSGAAYRLIHPDDKDKFIRLNMEAIDNKTQFVWEGRVMIDGEARVMHIESTPAALNDRETIWNGIQYDITERVKSEQDLRDSEKVFSTIFQANMFLMAISTVEDGWFINVNEIFLKTLGFERDEIIGASSAKLNIWANYEERNTVIKKLQETGSVRDFETRIKTKNGAILNAVFFADYISIGGKKYLLTIMEDITNRKRAENQLKKSEHLLANSQRLAKMGSWSWNIQTGEFIWSDELYRIYGKTKGTDEPSYELWFNSTHPEDKEKLDLHIRNAVSQKESFDTEFRIVKSDSNDIRYVHSSGEIVEDANDESIGLSGMVQDITERKETEMMLIQYADIVFRMQSGLLVFQLEDHSFDGSLRLVNINPASTVILGITETESIGKTIDEIFPNLREGNIPQKLAQVVRKGKAIGPSEFLYTISEENNKVLSVKAFPIPDDFVCVLFDDVTFHKQAEETQRQLETQLMQVQKMESIGKLAGGVAHDFNNILAVIIGYSDLVMTTLPEVSPIRENMEQVIKASLHAKDLTKQLLAFSRKQVMEIRVVYLNDVIQSIKTILTRILGEDVRVNTILSTQIGLIKADISQIEQVILNLSINSRDAMPNGGELTIETHRVELDEEFVKQHSEGTPGEYAMLSISDTGRGMDREMIQKIFDPFFTTKEKGKGTGLGLSTVYGIVKQHNGFISVYSELTQGTTFKIFFPCLKDDDDEPVVQDAETENIVKHSVREQLILVVEDDERVRKLVVKMLIGLSYEVREAQDLDECMRIAESIPKIDLLLTDVIMPKASGKQVVEKVLQIHPDTKVLYMSGYTDNVIAQHGVLDQGIQLITKPFTQTELQRKIRNILK